MPHAFESPGLCPGVGRECGARIRRIGPRLCRCRRCGDRRSGPGAGSRAGGPAGPEPGAEPRGDPPPHARVSAAGPGRRRQQEVPQVAREDPDGTVLGCGPQAGPQVDLQVDKHACAPGPPDGLDQPAVGGPTPVGDAETGGDGLLGGRQAGRPAAGPIVVVGVGDQAEVEDLLALPAQQRQCVRLRRARVRRSRARAAGRRSPGPRASRRARAR